MRGLAALALLAVSTTATAQPLTGTYRVGGATLVDPPQQEARDTHFYVELTEPSAKALYDAMKAKAVPDACGDPGTTTKRAGGVACSRGPKGREYRCWFGIDLRAPRLVHGVVC